MRARAVGAALLILSGCHQVAAVPQLPADGTPVAEPSGPIDPASAEAAGQVVQHYAALIEQRRFAEAGALWSMPAGASRFETQLQQFREVHMEIGAPQTPEGAAGSVFVRVPVIFYGILNTGSSFRRAASVALRRVNDVPGSTAEQRRWHIERISWTGELRSDRSSPPPRA